MEFEQTQEQREVTIDDLAKLKEAPVGDYFTIDPADGGVFLHDVLTLQPLEYGKVPEAIKQTPDLHEGLQYLQELGQSGRLIVQLVLGPHGAADDFDRIVHDYPDVLASPHIGLEMTGNADGSLLITPAPGRGEFQIAQLSWARRHNKVIFPCELQGDGQHELREKMNLLWETIITPSLAAARTDPIANTAGVIAERSYQAVRQWSILARLGFHMSRYGGDGLLLADEPIRIPLVLGSWHRPSAERLKMLGVPFEVYSSQSPQPDYSYADYGEMAMATTLLGYAPMDFLRTRIPYS